MASESRSSRSSSSRISSLATFGSKRTRHLLDSRGVVRSAPGDTLVLLTDGVTDCGIPEGELFAAERALEVIRSSRGARSADVVEGLYRAVQ
jgi:hypothetical protein